MKGASELASSHAEPCQPTPDPRSHRAGHPACRSTILATQIQLDVLGQFLQFCSAVCSRVAEFSCIGSRRRRSAPSRPVAARAGVRPGGDPPHRAGQAQRCQPDEYGGTPIQARSQLPHQSGSRSLSDLRAGSPCHRVTCGARRSPHGRCSSDAFSYPQSRSRPASGITVYRGATADRLCRMSWADDRNVARMLGRRHARHGQAALYSAVAEPVALLAFLWRPGEGSTVVVDIASLKDIQIVEQLPDPHPVGPLAGH
jgi:hypothetical protein